MQFLKESVFRQVEWFCEVNGFDGASLTRLHNGRTAVSNHGPVAESQDDELSLAFHFFITSATDVAIFSPDLPTMYPPTPMFMRFHMVSGCSSARDL